MKSRRALIADRELLLWLLAEKEYQRTAAFKMVDDHRRMAAVRKSERDKAIADLHAVERAAGKWQAIAQTSLAKPGTVMVERLDVENYGTWSAGAVAVLLEEHQTARAIVARLTEARASTNRIVAEFRAANICHPIQEQILKLVDQILTTKEGK